MRWEICDCARQRSGIEVQMPDFGRSRVKASAVLHGIVTIVRVGDLECVVGSPVGNARDWRSLLSAEVVSARWVIACTYDLVRVEANQGRL